MLLICTVNAAWNQWLVDTQCDPDNNVVVGSQQTKKPTYNSTECSDYCAKLLKYIPENSKNYCCYYQVITVAPEFINEPTTKNADCVLYEGIG